MTVLIKIKKCLLRLAQGLCLCCLLIIPTAHADGKFPGDLEGLEEISITQLNEWDKGHRPDLSAIRLTPDALAAALSQITEPLWKNTRPPAGRDILYLLPHKITAVEYGGGAINMFFNMTDDMRVTTQDLLNLEQKTFKELIEQILTPETESQLIPLFQKMITQERKFGYLIQAGFLFNRFTFQCNTSLQLAERNFWLSVHDRKEIKRLVQEIWDGMAFFKEKEMYKIRVGMGDTRLKLGMNTINMTSFQSDVGIEAIVPTSKLSYTPHIQRSNMSAFDKSDNDIPNEEFQKTLTSILKAVRDNAVNPRLGNGHWGLGCYYEGQVGLFHELARLWTRISYDYLLEGNEDRLIKFKQTMKPSDMTGTTPTNDKIKQYFREYVAPAAASCTIHPGGVLNFIMATTIDVTKFWRYSLGYDFYTQQQERIKSVHDDVVNVAALQIDDAETLQIRQHKIFTEIMYHVAQKYKDWGFGFGGDVTIKSKNIGDDWTLYFKGAVTF